MRDMLPTADDPCRVYCADVLDFLPSLPDDGCDLLMTSPPYERARTYGLAGRMPAGQAWVDWMVEVVKAAAPKVKGLIAINCEGQTRGYRYSCVPFLLVADLHRAGFNMRKPCVYGRNGIMGGGGPDWLRNDWEPVICVSRKGRLPWSDNTACGHPPKYGPGGPPSHRTVTGDRVGLQTTTRRNRGLAEPQVAAAVAGEIEMPRGSRLVRTPTSDGTMRTKLYRPPEKSNPGNVIDCGVVGGGHLGSDLAHENEAPFPLKLAEFFVRSFCPPGGLVLDPFCGSGTTAHAAVIHGRRFVGCDVRESQVELTARRLAEPLGVGGLFDTGAPVVADLFGPPGERP